MFRDGKEKLVSKSYVETVDIKKLNTFRKRTKLEKTGWLDNVGVIRVEKWAIKMRSNQEPVRPLLYVREKTSPEPRAKSSFFPLGNLSYTSEKNGLRAIFRT